MLAFYSECSHEQVLYIQPNTEYLLQVGAIERETTKTERKEGKNGKNREGQTYFGTLAICALIFWSVWREWVRIMSN